MKHISRSLQAAIILILIAAITSSGCRENTIINSKVSPSKDTLGVFSKYLYCIAHTYYDDTAITSTNIGGIPIYQAVGAMTDSFFGTMSGATFFQVIPTDFTSTFYTGDTIDSAILVLPYSGFTYGDTTNQNLTQTYQVYYMLDSMGAPLSSTYYSYNNKAIDFANPLSDPTTVNVYHLRDSFALNYLPQNHSGLRIKLRLPALLNRLNAAQAVLTSTSTNPAQDFINAFNGICVRTADNRQSTTAIPYFQLDGADPFSEAGILVYYHQTGIPVDSDFYESYYFNTGSCTHFNNIIKSFNQSPVASLIHSTNPNPEIIALQNQPGASLDVIVPGIKNLPIGVISKAELQLTLLPGYGNYTAGGSILLAPERLYPIGIGNVNYPLGVGNGVLYNIADRYPITSVSPLTVLDGYVHYNTATGVNTFTIDIPREVMSSITAKNDTIHLRINGTQDYYGAFHMVAGGSGYGNSNSADTMYRPKLFVVYSAVK